MEASYFLKIIRKYREGRASTEEINFVETYYRLFEMDSSTEMDLSLDELEERLDLLLKDKILKNIRPKDNNHLVKRRLIISLSAAAAIVIFAFGLFALLKENKQNKIVHTSQKGEKILPGSNKASLTLADGSVLDLSHLKKGNIASQANIKVKNLGNGQISYIDSGNNINKEEIYNVITTPMGGTYKLTLSDGSRVWLNAGSSLRYPVAFLGNHRQVELKGEAYFEVIHHSKRPFRVKVGDMTLVDLGTHFNIKAYNNEPCIQTTLLEGAVKLMYGQQTARLRPGQQATLESKKSRFVITEVDTTVAVAWKNGLFRFHHTSIEGIMQELERWYDVQVTYKGGDLRNMSFSGVMSRYSDVEQVLKRISLTGAVNFKIEGRQIIVTQ